MNSSTAPGPAPDSAASPLADRSEALAALVERIAAGTFAVRGRRGTLGVGDGLAAPASSSPRRTSSAARRRR